VTNAIPVLDELAEVPSGWVHVEKRIHPGEDLVVPGAYFKWYDIREAAQEATPEISEQARDYLRSEVDAGNMVFRNELGFAMLHRDGGYYLIVAVWRSKDELWTGIFFRDEDGAFKKYPVKPDALRATMNVVELDATAHERRAWARYLRSARDEAAKRAYIEDYCTGVVGTP
jgi:hypothetical protein